MLAHNQPIDSLDNLRRRVERLVKQRPRTRDGGSNAQLSLELASSIERERTVEVPSHTIGGFLDFLSDALPDGDVYLFGGVLRDIALLGRRGFNSDIDLVVEGNWDNCLAYIESLGARRNKFGGYRLSVGGWPIDIWSAKETWAIRKGLVPYYGIKSLTETTVLNWDAILMNWRTRGFVFQGNYIEEIRARVLRVVLKENPDPLGMVVRVLRHLCLKDARSITKSTADYLADAVRTYGYEDIRRREVNSYGNAVVERPIYRLFEHYGACEGEDHGSRFSVAGTLLSRELGLK